MIFNNFNFRIVSYVAMILITSLLFAWTLDKEFMVATTSGLAILLILETLGLIYHIKKVKRDLQRFIDAVKNQDTSLVFQSSGSDPFLKEIHEGFNEIITDFRLVRKEKELEHHFFQNTLKHIPIGLIAFKQNGIIILQNHAFQDIFQTEKLKQIEKLKTVHTDMPDLLNSLIHGDQSYLKVLVNNEIKNLSIKVSQLKLEKEKIKLVSFQDISREMDRNEAEAWQKLIRVLRHEIMNSISPIRIMSGNLLNLVSSETNKIEKTMAEDLTTGLKTIRKRSQGLSEFVESYRNISNIPQPNFSEINVQTLLNDVLTLFENDIRRRGIHVKTTINPENLTILGDEHMLHQVLINLIKNACESYEEDSEKQLHIKAVKDEQRTAFTIKDNGKGIPADRLESIFIPFYTTKNDGSGIGLSFSRQIMNLHNGSINLSSVEGEGTSVVLSF